MNFNTIISPLGQFDTIVTFTCFFARLFSLNDLTLNLSNSFKYVVKSFKYMYIDYPISTTNTLNVFCFIAFIACLAILIYISTSLINKELLTFYSDNAGSSVDAEERRRVQIRVASAIENRIRLLEVQGEAAAAVHNHAEVERILREIYDLVKQAETVLRPNPRPTPAPNPVSDTSPSNNNTGNSNSN